MNTQWLTLLITGLRGNGKTLMAVSMMDEFVQAGVPVYACNFTDLSLPGVQFLEDPHGWRDLPPGSVLFVDEAQRYWRSRRHGDVPQSIIEMETQRHDGIRMVLLTQQPTYLDKHLRGLIDVHRHLVRRAGIQASQVYEWEKCKEEVDTPANLDLAEASIFPFPKQYFGSYKSAEVHTVKPKIPMRLKLIGAGALVVGALFWFGLGKVKPAEKETATATGEPAETSGEAAGTAGRTARKRPQTREEYLLAMVPRITGAPWSAPVYDEANRVGDAPEVVCMIGTKCICITTQGTRYEMGQAACRVTVYNGGILNPYKGQKREDRDRGDMLASPGIDSPGVGGAHVDRSPGAVIEADGAQALTAIGGPST